MLPVIVDAAFPHLSLVPGSPSKVFRCRVRLWRIDRLFRTQLFEQISVRMHPQDAMEVLDLRANNILGRLVEENFKRFTWNDDDTLSGRHLHSHTS